MNLTPWHHPVMERLGHTLGDRFEPWHWTEYYPRYAAWARQVQPRAILEIGVRYGYTALAMLSPLSESRPLYRGVDNESYAPGCLQIAHEMLKIHTPWALTRFLKMDTYDGIYDFGETYDLIHVDGDHTEAGALRDLRLAWARLTPGGVLILDDWHFPEVKAACATFLKKLPGKDVVTVTYWDGPWGHAYLERR